MNSLRKQLEDEEQGLRKIRTNRRHRKPPNTGKKFQQVFYVLDKDLENWDDVNLDIVDEFTSSAIVDKNFDSIGEEEIDNIVASLKSGLDVSVCDNAFTIPANAPIADVEVSVGKRRSYEKKLVNVISAAHAKGVEEWQKQRPFVMLQKRLNRDKQYAFRQFPDKDKRRATGMKYALIMSNVPLGKEGHTILYFHTLKAAREKMREFIADYGYEQKHLETMKVVGD